MNTFLYIFKTDFILLNAYDSFHSVKEVNTLWTKMPEAVGICYKSSWGAVVPNAHFSPSASADSFTVATSSSKHGVFGLKKHSSTHSHDVETKYYLGYFSTWGAMYASLSPSFLTPCRISSPSSGIPFHVSLLLSGPKLTEHLVLKHSCCSKDSENSCILNDIFFLISVVH